MTNFIQNNWRPEYNGDPYLKRLFGTYSAILDTYQGHLDRYGDSESGSSDEGEDEIWLQDKVPEYNARLADLETDFSNYVLETYGHRIT